MSQHQQTSPNIIWLIGAAFVLFQFFLQLSSGIVIGAIMHDMHLSALCAGVLSSSFYVVYTGLQIPVGILFDHNNPRTLLTVNALLCSLGCVIFATSYSLEGLFIGRTVIGAGSAFAFVGLTHLLRQYYPLNKFAFMIGLSETLGFLATVLGIIGMGAVITTWGWREFIFVASLFGFTIGVLCWRYIPNEKQTKHLRALQHPITCSRTPHPPYGHLLPVSGEKGKAAQDSKRTTFSLQTRLTDLSHMIDILRHQREQLTIILSNKRMWANGLFIGLSFSIVTVFGALWAASFIQIKLNCSLRQASLINAMFFLGTGLSCPLFGALSNYFSRRKPLILSSSLLTICLLLLLLYWPIHTLNLMAGLMFLIGLSCGAYILAFPIANELSPAHLLSTSTGFTNTLALITTPLLQPLIGYLLDASTTNDYYTLADYQNALLVIPISLLGACMLVYCLPEKNVPTRNVELSNLPGDCDTIQKK